MTFIPRKKPVGFWLWFDGVSHSVDNPGAIRGDVIADTLTAWNGAETWCDNYSLDALCVHAPIGGLAPPSPGQPGRFWPTATAGVMQIYYPAQWDFFTNTFPDIKRPGREYHLYIGGRQNEPFGLNDYVTDNATAKIPSPQFFVDAVGPFRDLGFTGVWLDALAGEPAIADQANPVIEKLRENGWWVGNELWPHTGIDYPNGQKLELNVVEARKYAAVNVARLHNGQLSNPDPALTPQGLFAPRFRGAPSGTELHIMPQSGDSLVSPAMVQQWISQGCVVSMQEGFQVTRPDTAAWLRDYYANYQDPTDPDCPCRRTKVRVR